MGADDEIRHATEDAAGHIKEGVGKATHNEQLEAEGQKDQVKASLGKAADNVKDAVRK